MTWVKIDDSIFNSPGFLSVGKDAKLLHFAATAYAGMYLTDGAIPRHALPILAAQTGVTATKKPVSELITAGLWREDGDDFRIVGFLDLNTSAEEVQAKRDAARDRMKRNRSQNVRANTPRSSREVRLPEDRRQREQRTDAGNTVAEGDGAEGANWGWPAANPVPSAPHGAASRRAASPQPSTAPASLPVRVPFREAPGDPSPTVPHGRAAWDDEGDVSDGWEATE